ncbi:MAG TPA: hypothetical protein ENJ99_06500 [Rhizobiales bacterium]|nr:hypothetical protein [Hyphomicrobiales bacterium]
MRGMSRLTRLLLGSFLWLAVLVSTAGAAALSQTEIEQRRQRLFAIMLEQPSNLDVAFEYAALSARAGDLEGAVSTLERMLIFAPGLARIQLELGVLYFRLGSYQTARDYLNAAISGPNTPEEVRKKVKVYLAAIEKQLKPLIWTASTYVGLRWQSNANQAPETRTVLLNGLPFTLGRNASRKSDFNVFEASQAHIEYDLQSQGDRIEIDYVDYSSWYFDETWLDTVIAEITIGPSFNLDRFGMENSFASVYAIVNGSLLGRKKYYGTLGAGARFVTRPSNRSEIISKVEYRRRWYDNNSDRPRATGRNGAEYRGLVEARYLFSPQLTGAFAGRVTREAVRVNFLDNWEYGGQASLTYTLTPPPGTPRFPWKVSLTGGYLHRTYDSPDPAINALAKQRDDEFWIGGSLYVPLAKWLTLAPMVEFRRVSSNYKIRDHKAFTATIGLNFRL